MEFKRSMRREFGIGESIVRYSGIYLRLPNCRVVPMKQEFAGFVSLVQEALAHGAVVLADRKHGKFYDLEVDGTCFYVHLYSERRTVYIVAKFPLHLEVNQSVQPRREIFRAVMASVCT